jgi:hypothetical protein
VGSGGSWLGWLAWPVLSRRRWALLRAAAGLLLPLLAGWRGGGAAGVEQEG